VALGVLVLTFEASVRPVESIPGTDVTGYEAYGARMLDGAIPYRDFRMEYPPAASLMFVVPSIAVVAGGSADKVSWSPLNAEARRYYRGFTSLVLLLLAVILVLTAVTLAAMRRPARAVLLSLAVIATSPLLIGQVLPERFDVWPAALTAAALAASVHGMYRLGGALLGLGAAAKLYPALLLPVLVIVVLRQRGIREAVFVTTAALAAAAVVFIPFVIASPSGTWESLRVQFRSGLQIETVASSILVMSGHAAQTLTELDFPFTTRWAEHGLARVDLVGAGDRLDLGVDATKTGLNVLLAASLCLLWISLARSRSDVREDLLRYAAATVAIALVLGTVLSAQFVIWLLPLVPLVGGRRGVAAILCFVAAGVLTHVWFPDEYFPYQDSLDAGGATILLARNLALLAIATVLVLPADALRRGRVPLRPRSVRDPSLEGDNS
jgi:hypothetical protein